MISPYPHGTPGSLLHRCLQVGPTPHRWSGRWSLPLWQLEVQEVLQCHKHTQMGHINCETDKTSGSSSWLSCGVHTDWSLGCLGIRGDAELSGAGLVLSRHPEYVGEPLQQTFNVQLSVRDNDSEDQDRRRHSENQPKHLAKPGF